MIVYHSLTRVGSRWPNLLQVSVDFRHHHDRARFSEIVWPRKVSWLMDILINGFFRWNRIKYFQKKQSSVLLEPFLSISSEFCIHPYVHFSKHQSGILYRSTIVVCIQRNDLALNLQLRSTSSESEQIFSISHKHKANFWFKRIILLSFHLNFLKKKLSFSAFVPIFFCTRMFTPGSMAWVAKSPLPRPSWHLTSNISKSLALGFGILAELWNSTIES